MVTQIGKERTTALLHWAAERPARQPHPTSSNGMAEATAPDMPQSIKMGQTEGAGCMAVLVCID
jgi:hypothetical protein